MKQLTMTTRSVEERKGMVHCPICTHTVNAEVVLVKRNLRVKPGAVRALRLVAGRRLRHSLRQSSVTRSTLAR
jgi:hypothetical protein